MLRAFLAPFHWALGSLSNAARGLRVALRFVYLLVTGPF